MGWNLISLSHPSERAATWRPVLLFSHEPAARQHISRYPPALRPAGAPDISETCRYGLWRAAWPATIAVSKIERTQLLTCQ
jgi:hypothetical protein